MAKKPDSMPDMTPTTAAVGRFGFIFILPLKNMK